VDAATVSGVVAVRMFLVMVLFLVVQSTIGLDLHVDGVHPDLMLLLPIGGALAVGAEEGAVIGFVAGLAADLFLPTPFGLSALVYCLLGFGVGLATVAIDKDVWWLAPVVALAGSAGATMLYAVLGAVLGQEQFLRVNLVAVVLVVSVTNAVLAAPAVRLVRWAVRPVSGERPRTPVRVGMPGSRW
jgi:rod shape-determining protein MreD